MLAALPAFAVAALLLAPQEEDDRNLAQRLADGEEASVDRVLVILNDQVITQSQVNLEAERILRADPTAEPGEVLGSALFGRLRHLIAREGFDRLGLDATLLEDEAAARLAGMIEEAGSRARFEQRVRAQGYDLASFREALQQELVLRTWSSIVVGDQPSPLEGYRNQISITPAMIREEYERRPELWSQTQALEWVTLQFFDDVQGSGQLRAEETVARLRQGTLSVDEAAARANSAVRDSGEPARKNLRSDLRDFLLQAAPGDISPVDRLEGLGAQIVVLTGRQEARQIPFEEAQPRIMAQLREERREAILTEELARLVGSSYFWYAEDLSMFMAQVPWIQRDASTEREL